MIDVPNRRIATKNNTIDFSEITIMEGFYFRNEYDETGNKRFHADIDFVATKYDKRIPLKLRFDDVTDLKIDRYGVSIYGFDIIDNKERGWQNDSRYRYHFEDDEYGVMDFYCSGVRLLA